MNSYSSEDPVAELLRTSDHDIPLISRDPESMGANNANHMSEDYQLVPQNKFLTPVMPPLQPLSESVLPSPGSTNWRWNGSSHDGLMGDGDGASYAGGSNDSNPSSQHQIHGNSNIKANGSMNGNNGGGNNQTSLSDKSELSTTANSNSSLINQNARSKRKKEPPKTKPAFVMKIWSMVNDPANSNYIRWSDDGKSFHVFHREDFMRNILPKYFKHNNFASFVRQLNMYGWHKVQDINTGSLYSQIRVETQGMEEVWQFENPYFQKGREDLLDKIVRNKSGANDTSEPNETNNSSESANFSSQAFRAILNELDQIKRNQMAINEDLRRVRKDNKTLWQENFMARERHQQQAQTLEKILTFLATLYGNNTSKISSAGSNVPNNYQESGGEVIPWAMGGPIPSAQTDTLSYPPPSPYSRPRPMLMNQAYRSPLSVVSGSNNDGDNSIGLQANLSESIPSTNSGQFPIDANSSMNADASANSNANASANSNANPNANSNANPNASSNASSSANASANANANANASLNATMNANNVNATNLNANLNASLNALPLMNSPTDKSSVEDIIRSYNNSPRDGTENQYTNRFIQQLMDSNPQSPRAYFPELSRNGSHPDMHHLETNINKQGQSIQQVQDWIQKLAAQQKDGNVSQNGDNGPNSAGAGISDFDEFDVNDFLKDSQTPSNDLEKRNIEEVVDEEEAGPPKKKKPEKI